MSEYPFLGPARDEGRPLQGLVAMVVLGLAIGLFYNWIGLRSRPAWGIDWKGENKLELLAEAPEIAAVDDPFGDAMITTNNDPLAPVASAAVPEIPNLPGRWVKIGLDATHQLWNADAALFIDAREDFEFAEGHIPGALSLPYTTASTDPMLLESLDSQGRPIVVYCGGGTCELSVKMAEELLFAGLERVAVYEGGYPEWVEAGHPTDGGAK